MKNCPRDNSFFFSPFVRQKKYCEEERSNWTFHQENFLFFRPVGKQIVSTVGRKFLSVPHTIVPVGTETVFFNVCLPTTPIHGQNFFVFVCNGIN